MSPRMRLKCADLVRCIEGLVEEHVRTAPREDIEHARRELSESVAGLVEEVVREAVMEGGR